MTYETLHKAMTEALKAGRKDEKNALAGFIAQIQKTAIDKGCRDNITEDLVNAELLKIKKSIQEQIDTCPVTRTDLMDKYCYEMAVVDKYAPVMISDEDVIRGRIVEIVGGETVDKKQRGMVMKAIKGEVANSVFYDMAAVNKVIGEMLV
jgi:uncharacterized protein YqeY